MNDIERLKRPYSWGPYTLPAHTQKALVGYYEYGLDPGRFCYAALTNSLFETFRQADIYNQRNIFAVVTYIWNELPRNCYGNKEKVADWIKKGGIHGKNQDETDKLSSL